MGRRTLLCSSMVVGGVALLCSVLTVTVFKAAPSRINTALAMVGKLAVSCAIALIFIFEGEIYPTTVRSFLQGGGTTAGQIGSMVSPYIGKINNLIKIDLGSSLDLILFGVIMFCAGMVALMLPETRNKKLPDTIEEANQLKGNNISTGALEELGVLK
ncbi:hypothetical protein KUTeg_019781 [Tegillarca granosa]|uniref:Major facilitator superfamily (MFS) profile domain-containing protein n=1 Tax=Tegillarca granosa TaxID=220873 RepID=A0ABQ9EIP2_TEGGR|nr:hypothetical protein KUTeg_019781 [Tegillarca granosa]